MFLVIFYIFSKKMCQYSQKLWISWEIFSADLEVIFYFYNFKISCPHIFDIFLNFYVSKSVDSVIFCVSLTLPIISVHVIIFDTGLLISFHPSIMQSLLPQLSSPRLAVRKRAIIAIGKLQIKIFLNQSCQTCFVAIWFNLIYMV